ncbi:uncharacterized protein LOC127137877 [Lathyrus oleraceus]|uniref:uncharacterized protein LOC127137877 n=1 Tax=Pisum sativum TaxID=3888 RepID=UPI0021CEBC73|nr:uncharacterized protein LOC127137877 [Pisum sativum]
MQLRSFGLRLHRRIRFVFRFEWEDEDVPAAGGAPPPPVSAADSAVAGGAPPPPVSAADSAVAAATSAQEANNYVQQANTARIEAQAHANVAMEEAARATDAKERANVECAAAADLGARAAVTEVLFTFSPDDISTCCLLSIEWFLLTYHFYRIKSDLLFVFLQINWYFFFTISFGLNMIVCISAFVLHNKPYYRSSEK